MKNSILKYLKGYVHTAIYIYEVQDIFEFNKN